MRSLTIVPAGATTRAPTMMIDSHCLADGWLEHESREH
jgi:hypothetical protein